ncbi:hypothetical protein SAMN06264364_119114 [Quadrisphaera granulorum]|uniref:PIN domain-containing protein n=1 Tax=Quadrisphaera granulorum TaxID=317664 RepID=A0A316A500_9ACTN|nr:hypothetical protein [Quadrisphaera granulorum]PWJ52619.1 hypothetical protein BXY45_119114 [Quadrisphaera granulorum]SZE97669.1 hypothetical protein SAMN06264364_119114 [Quadrisphaera granulorum]
MGGPASPAPTAAGNPYNDTKITEVPEQLLGGNERAPIRVILADANVLYSRVLRDYLLYAATGGLLEIRWSAAILAEVIEHLAENIAGFDATAGARLLAAMNGAFPAAEVELDSEPLPLARRR